MKEMGTANCSACGTALPAGLLACPRCQELVYKTEIESFARRARELGARHQFAEAAALWRRALDFVPPESSQAQEIREQIAALEAQPAPPKRDWKKALGPIGVAGAFLFKFKTVVLLALTKAKFLFLGLGKIQTLLSMFATIGFYWSAFGWRYAVGFVVGIYIHEMGHVWMLRHYGLRASAPMFIPGFGAFVSLYDSPANVGQDARIGLAGPLWGAAAALLFLVPGVLTGQGVWLAVAHSTAYINLFNLIPIWTLDGGRAFRALDRKQR